MFLFLQQTINFYNFAERRHQCFCGGGFGFAKLALGLYGGLVWAPPDYQQGDAYRIIFVHVPAAWMSLLVYSIMAALAFCGVVWNFKMAAILAGASAGIGASFTFIALITGGIWGKPMWGTWWVWDARLTSELVLFFFFGIYQGNYCYAIRRIASCQCGYPINDLRRSGGNDNNYSRTIGDVV